MFKYVISAVIFFLLIITGCQHSDHTQQHSESPEAISYTLFKGDYELFMEFDPLISNDTSDFIVHLTTLSDYKPVRDGLVSISLKGADFSQDKIIEKISRPGIFRAGLIPHKCQKNLMLTINYQNDTSQVVFEIPDIVIYCNHEEWEHEHEHEHHQEVSDDIVFLKEQAWEVDFQTAEVNEKNFHEVVKASGQLLPVQSALHTIIASNNGIVRLEAGSLLPGQLILKGQLLFSIIPGNLLDQNINTRYLEKKADYEKAKSDIERAGPLVRQKIISEKEYLEIKLRYDKAEANFNAISSNYAESGTPIISPEDAFITEVFKSNGDHVVQGEKLLEMLETDNLLLKVDLPQDQLRNITRIRGANFIISGGGKTFSTEELNGRIISVSRITDDDNNYIPLYFEIKNPGELIPGIFTETYLQLETNSEALVIPLSAVMESEGDYFVYVQTGGESFIRRDLELGGNDGKYVLVQSGLSRGDRVVTEGAYRIKLASMSGELPSHGHVH